MPNPSTLAMEDEQRLTDATVNVETFASVVVPKAEHDALLDQAHAAHEFGKILQQVRDLLGIAPERPLVPAVEALKQEVRVLKDLNHELHLEVQELEESRDTIRAHAQASLNEYRAKGYVGSGVCECCATYECDCLQPDDV
jgi:hypothetical protein